MDRYRYILVDPLGPGEDRLSWTRDGKSLPQLLEEGWVPERESGWGDFVLVLLHLHASAGTIQRPGETQGAVVLLESGGDPQAVTGMGRLSTGWLARLDVGTRDRGPRRAARRRGKVVRWRGGCSRE